jgi:hypothetical protein
MLTPNLVQILQIANVIITIWSIFFSTYFLKKWYSSYKVHFLSIISVGSSGAILIIARSFTGNDNIKLIFIISISIILLISLGRQIYLYFMHRYIANLDKILVKFAKKYNVSNYHETSNFEFKDMVDKANSVFKDSESTISEKFTAVKVLKRIAKLSEWAVKYKELTGNDLIKKKIIK